MRQTVAFALVLVASSCAGHQARTADPDAVVVSRDIAFDLDEITIRAGEAVTIVHDHQDGSIPHNLHVQGVPGDPRTDVVPGPVRQELAFTVDEPGDYRFICDVHPNMRGTLVVE